MNAESRLKATTELIKTATEEILNNNTAIPEEEARVYEILWDLITQAVEIHTQ